jgi:hypothetical protein
LSCCTSILANAKVPAESSDTRRMEHLHFRPSTSAKERSRHFRCGSTCCCTSSFADRMLVDAHRQWRGRRGARAHRHPRDVFQSEDRDRCHTRQALHLLARDAPYVRPFLATDPRLIRGTRRTFRFHLRGPRSRECAVSDRTGKCRRCSLRDGSSCRRPRSDLRAVNDGNRCTTWM